MTEDFEQLYRKHESYIRYIMENKKRVNEIRKVYNSNKSYFGKKILDIGCGGGILGFLIEKDGHQYTGIDINPDMINEAKDYSKKINSKNKFLLKDITKEKIKGNFNTIIFIGNGLAHLTTSDFVKVLRNISKAKYFIIDYRDVIELLFKKKWKDKMIEHNKRISLTKNANFNEGFIKKVSFENGGKNKINFVHTIWSPFILEPIMESNDWKLVKRKKEKLWDGWLDIYKKK